MNIDMPYHGVTINYGQQSVIVTGQNKSI